jgi:hypothetical protein
MVASLNPQRLTPTASLNRAKIVDLPGLAVDPEVRGQTGYQLVSTVALAQLIRQHAKSLELDPSLDDHELCVALDRRLVSEDRVVRDAAEGLGRCIGRNMGYILLTLKRGDPVNRAARAEWDDSYWEHWSRIKQVWLGGGMVSGRLGAAIRDHASAVIREADIRDYTLRISPYASMLPLVGVARYAPSRCQTALVFDFGSTLIKCGNASYSDGALLKLRCLPSRPTELARIEHASKDPADQAAQLLDHMVSVIVDTWRLAGRSVSSPILASVAAYIQDGHPLSAQGGAYMQLRHVTDHVQTALARQLSARLGEAVDVSLFHDGTAAAATYAGTRDAAIIMVGTALGIGFPPQEESNLRPISADLAILAPGGA